MAVGWLVFDAVVWLFVTVAVDEELGCRLTKDELLTTSTLTC